MRDMFQKKIIRLLLILYLVITVITGACSRPASSNSSVNAPASSVTSPPEQNAGIEFEIVTPQVIEGSITATGKILVTENGTASIGPVHEGRIVRLYAGQGSVVKKGQRLAD